MFFSIFKSQVSGKENVQLPDSPDFENLPDFWTGCDVLVWAVVIECVYSALFSDQTVHKLVQTSSAKVNNRW